MSNLRRRLHVWTALALFTLPLYAQLAPGTDRWKVKTSLDAGAKTKPPKQVQVQKLISMTGPDQMRYHYADYEPGKPHENDRMRDPNSSALQEGDIVTITGYVQLVALESSKESDGKLHDGDYHIQVSPTRDDRKVCMVVEAPKPEFVAVQEPEFQGLAGIRQQLFTAFASAKDKQNGDFSSGGTCVAHPTKMTFTGQLFYDSHHARAKPAAGAKYKKSRGKGACDASFALWELHPIDKAAFAEKKTGLSAVPCKPAVP